MTPQPRPTTIDPLAALLLRKTGRTTAPLVSVEYEVEIAGGLAMVAARRTFRNEEAQGIEATVVMPAPVQAALFSLEARIDGRVLKARAQKRAVARATYEDAVDRGKTAVLHEETLRGVHMISVAHLGAGREIEVRSTWAQALDVVGDSRRLRIPLTVGDVYGCAPPSDSDALVHGGPATPTTLRVRCRDGSVSLGGQALQGDAMQVPADAPIDLVVQGAETRTLRGRAAEGRIVSLRFAPHRGEAALDALVLVDRSGSMTQRCGGAVERLTKHQAALVGLRAAARRVRPGDVLDLWEFSTEPARLGSTADEPRAAAVLQGGLSRSAFDSLIDRLSPPDGGTEIGRALEAAIAGSKRRDVLLLTDGKSHEIDVQALARRGRRVSVLLMGEDSLEANVGHLAALTGGGVLAVGDGDASEAAAAMLDALRIPFVAAAQGGAALGRLRVVRGATEIEASWSDAADGPLEDEAFGRAVAAYAASLALASLTEEAAAALAEAEGLAGHLTSLVLVDEGGDTQQALPVTRKIALPTPRMASMPVDALYMMRMPPAACAAMAPPPEPTAREKFSHGRSKAVEVERRTLSIPAAPRRQSPAAAGGVRLRSLDESTRRAAAERLVRGADEGPAEAARRPLASLVATLDWDSTAAALASGDVSGLPGDTAEAMREAAAREDIRALASSLGVDPLALVAALMALSKAASNRAAARLVRAVIRVAHPRKIEAALRALGLEAATA